MVPPGCLSSIAGGERSRWWSSPTGRAPASSTTKTRSASPSKARPDVGRRRRPRGLQVALVRGLDRVGGVVGEGPVELAVHDLELDLGQALEHLGTTRPPMPLAVSATTRSGRQRRRSTKRHDVVGELVQQVDVR